MWDPRIGPRYRSGPTVGARGRNTCVIHVIFTTITISINNKQLRWGLWFFTLALPAVERNVLNVRALVSRRRSEPRCFQRRSFPSFQLHRIFLA